MRYKENKIAVQQPQLTQQSYQPSTSSLSNSSSLNGYTGKLTAAGKPDMRTSAGKAYVA